MGNAGLTKILVAMLPACSRHWRAGRCVATLLQILNSGGVDENT